MTEEKEKGREKKKGKVCKNRTLPLSKNPLKFPYLFESSNLTFSIKKIVKPRNCLGGGIEGVIKVILPFKIK